MAEIRNYIVPRKLYQYRSIDNIDRELETIDEAYLFCSAYKDMNDPMGCIWSVPD
jgi:hypothetical protein